MPLPDYIYSSLENALIPLRGIVFGSLTLAVAGTLGTWVLPQKPAQEATGMTTGMAVVGLVSSGFCLGINFVLIRDSQKRLELMQRRYTSTVVAQRREPLARPAQSPTVPARPVSFRDELIAMRPQMQTVPKPLACGNCENYVGQSFSGQEGTHPFICAIYPYGPTGETCPDHESFSREYRLVRIQGSGFQNLYFVSLGSGLKLSDIFQGAIEIPRGDRSRLMKRYRVKSTSGLPGCVFHSKATDLATAYQELLDSCPECLD